MKRESQVLFCKESLYKPTYLQDNNYMKSIDNNIGIHNDNSRSCPFRSDNRRETCRATEDYKPVKDPSKEYELNRIRRRYKLNFNHKLNAYSTKYIGEFSSLLGQRKNKNYLTQRKKMIEKYEPKGVLVTSRNNQGTFYLTDNQKTIYSHRQSKPPLSPSKFHFIPLQKKKIKPLHLADYKDYHNGSPRLTSENTHYDYKYENDKETGEFNLIVTRDDDNDNMNKAIERENIKEYLKNRFNFFDNNNSKSRNNHYYIKKNYIPENVVSYIKNNNPSKVEYMKKLMLNKNNIPSVISHELLPNLQGFYKNSRNYDSQQTFKTVIM